MEIRKAKPQELDQIYEVDFDVWAEGSDRVGHKCSADMTDALPRNIGFRILSGLLHVYN